MTKGKASPYVWCEHCQTKVLAVYHRCKIDRPPERDQATKIPPADTGDRCGANLAVVGQAHRCAAVNTAPAVHTAVNATPPPAVNKAKAKRGAYPGTDDRRAYMRSYMKKYRPGGQP